MTAVKGGGKVGGRKRRRESKLIELLGEKQVCERNKYRDALGGKQ